MRFLAIFAVAALLSLGGCGGGEKDKDKAKPAADSTKAPAADSTKAPAADSTKAPAADSTKPAEPAK